MTLIKSETLLIILAHPKTDSFCASCAQVLCQRCNEIGRLCIVRDLYAEAFDPVMGPNELDSKSSFDALILSHQEDLRQAGSVVFIGPEWWGRFPAILEGWLDRVLRPGIAYNYQEDFLQTRSSVGLLNGQTWHLVVSSDSAAQAEHPLKTTMFDHGAAFCGALAGSTIWCGPQHDASWHDRREWLSGVSALAARDPSQTEAKLKGDAP